MTRLYAALGVLVLFLGLGYYAKTATERAALAEAAVETLAAGYEQYEDRIEEAQAATLQRDREWRALENEYQTTIDGFKQVPATQCDLAAVDPGITDRLLSAAGYDSPGGADPAEPAGADPASRAAPHLSNRGQSDWIAGYQRRLDQCNASVLAIRKLRDQAEKSPN